MNNSFIDQDGFNNGFLRDSVVNIYIGFVSQVNHG